MMDLLLSSFITVSTLGILACLLALCTLCRRKHRKRALPQDGVRLVDAPLLRPAELSESAAEPQKLKRANSRGKNQRLAGVNLPLPPREDDGTASVSSFTILTQRQLPHIPLEDLSATEETYSNLTFPGPTQEILYESVTMNGRERDQPSLIKAEEGLPRGQEDQASRAEYACVLKAQKKEELPQIEAGDPQATPRQEPCPAKTTLNPPIAQVEEMYSVVCKARKKKKITDSEGDGEERPHHVEMSHRDSQLAAVHHEPDSRVETRPSSSLSPVLEPCYDSVSRESLALPDRREVTEPAYETVDTHWTPSRRKRKANPNRAAENLYESIENLTLELRNQNLLSRSET